MNRKWMLKMTGLAAGVAIFAAACGQAVVEGVSPPPENETKQEVSLSPLDEVISGLPEIEGSGLVDLQIDSSEYELVYKLAQEDLARRLELNAESILFLTIERVLWSDTSLGNPEPDMAYDDVEIPGFKLVLFAQEGVSEDGREAIGQAYLYHTTTEEEVVFVGETEVPEQTGVVTLPGERAVHIANGDLFIEPLPLDDGVEPSDYEGVLKLAISDLAQRLDLDVDEIALGDIKSATWPNTALGNPEPGMAYAEILVPGFLVILEADGTLYRYQTSLTEAVFVERTGGVVLELIRVPEPGVVLEPGDDYNSGGASMGMPAPGEGDLLPDMIAIPVDEIAPDEYADVLSMIKDELAQEMDIDTEAIDLVEIAREEWSDTSLGNPEPDVLYAQVITPGFKMILEAGGQFFFYHTSLDQAVLVGVEEIVVNQVEPEPLIMPEEVIESATSVTNPETSGGD